MRRPLYFVAAIIAISSVAWLSASPGQAADLNVNKRHVSRSDCGPSGCRRHRITYGCPDRCVLLPVIWRLRPVWWSSLLGCVLLRLLILDVNGH